MQPNMPGHGWTNVVMCAAECGIITKECRRCVCTYVQLHLQSNCFQCTYDKISDQKNFQAKHSYYNSIPSAMARALYIYAIPVSPQELGQD